MCNYQKPETGKSQNYREQSHTPSGVCLFIQDLMHSIGNE